MRYLVVAAHPDDEALGVGAMIHKVSAAGDEVYVCLLSHWSPTRDDDLMKGIEKSHEVLGVKKSYIADFGCMRFKDADHHEMVRFIEAAIRDCRPDVVITHHPADVHIDHGVTSECCMEAVRLPQRQIMDGECCKISKVAFMEVPSSTDWSADVSRRGFSPNSFVAVRTVDIDAKFKAIQVYKDVMRDAPHPRSEAAIIALSTFRGCQCGSMYAESMQLAFEVEV